MKLLQRFFKKTKSGSKRQFDIEDVDEKILKAVDQLLNGRANNVFDIGAHVGRFALAASKFWPSAKIYCFEPFSDSFKTLQANLENQNCVIYNTAISSIESKSIFYINKNSETNSILKPISTNSIVDIETLNVNKLEVETLTLDNFFTSLNIENIDFLKIDTQGATFEVLTGASKLLQEKRIRVIQCEVEFVTIYENEKLFNHIWSLLESFQYKLYSLFNLHYEVNGRLSWADAVFIL